MFLHPYKTQSYCVLQREIFFFQVITKVKKKIRNI